jgi:hypothetical protein
VLKTVAAQNGRFAACITPPAAVAARVCASQEAAHGGFKGFSLTLDLKIKPSAPVGASRLKVTAAAGASLGKATALIRVARG